MGRKSRNYKRKKKVINPAEGPVLKQEQASSPVQTAVSAPPASAPEPAPQPSIPAPAPAAPPPPKPAPKPAGNKNKITLSDVKGLTDAKEIVFDSLINPVLYPEVYSTLGVIPGTGLLLYGPPGTGKTMFGRAIANELNTEFLSVTLTEIKGKTPLQTVQMISNLFTKARSCPNGCVLCLDDCEEILSRPGSSKAYGVSQFLNELDGLKKTTGKGRVFVLIATNRPWMIDGALLRSGRISASVYVGLPEEETRKEIILSALEGILISEDVDVDKLAAITEGYSCAEIYHGLKGGGICNLARTYASRRWVERIKKDPAQKEIVEPLVWQDFVNAMKEVTPAAVRDAERISQINKFREMFSLRKEEAKAQASGEEEELSDSPEFNISGAEFHAAEEDNDEDDQDKKI
ncbi:MAG: ATP-binding protein [Lentisphaeria bacterium]|nr:ATP-binding protein [Lentisphaeria bacterium]